MEITTNLFVFKKLEVWNRGNGEYSSNLLQRKRKRLHNCDMILAVYEKVTFIISPLHRSHWVHFFSFISYFFPGKFITYFPEKPVRVSVRQIFESYGIEN